MKMTFTFALALLVGCSSGTDDDTAARGDDDDVSGVPDDYSFTSRFDEASSVSYSGQVMRQVLIADLKGHVGGLQGRLDSGWFPADADEVQAELDFYFRFDSSTSGALEHSLSTNPSPLQSTWDDISTDKDLVGKLAGNDPEGQHVDWTEAFVGYGAASPEALVSAWFEELGEASVQYANGKGAVDPSGAPLPPHVTADGRDLQQLLEKFLRGAVSYSQGTDDYLDDDLDGKGLLADHSAADDGANYTALEHAWDEGFGFFGASRHYGSLSDEIIADVGYDDANGDGSIDLLSEMTYGHATNAAKRDLGSVSGTDYSAVAFEAFVAGRHLLATTDGPLDDEALDTLRHHRDQAVGAWEKAIAATVVHYINDTLQDMGRIGTNDYSFADHAKHWSELKGFALSLQFNPHSPLTDAELQQLDRLIGDAPVLGTASTAEQAAYADDLRAARALLGEAYDFAPADLGDDDGTNGW